MVNEMVHLRLDPKMRLEIQKVIKDNTFSNESEFIRQAIREYLDLQKKIKLLYDMRGTLKRSKNPTKIPRSELFRAVGLED